MTKKNIIKKVLTLPLFESNPPVLIDIGASGQIHSKWKKIAKYSVCVAFDADDREFKFIENEKSNYKKLFVVNSIVTNKFTEKTNFYLTKSPFCSSVLKPNQTALEPYIHSDLFQIEKVVELRSINLQHALDELGIKKIDWFKTDSQGIDLSLFKCLKDDIRAKIIVSEFEPGIIDAYEGEDKLYTVLEYLTSNNFWLADIIIKGVPRISKELLNKEFHGSLFKKLLKESIKKSPGWGEMTFLNNFEDERLDERDFLLGWVFATIEQQYSFAFLIAQIGKTRFNNLIFDELKSFSLSKLKLEVYKLKFIPSVITYIKKFINK